MQVVSHREEFQWLLLVVIGFLLSLLPESFLWLGCLSLVLLVGVPHGALDIYLLWFEDKKSFPRFFKSLLKYISLVLFGLFIWKISPECFWALFFAAAIYHFGSSDEHPEVLKAFSASSFYKVVWILSRGTVLVFTPAFFHSAKITHYLSQAAPLTFAKQITDIAPFLVAYAGLFFVWTTFQSWKKAALSTYRLLLLKHLCSLGILVLLFAVSDPLLSFTLYFCCHHSLTHTFRVIRKIYKKIRPIWVVGFGTLVTLGVLPILGWVSKQMALGATPEGRVTASFVAIAALTFPHLIVVQKMHENLRLRSH